MKHLTADKAIERMPFPANVRIPLDQHLGTPCKPTVRKGEIVKKGQQIGKADAPVSAPVHSSVSGKVRKIEHAVTCSSLRSLCVMIENDRQDTWTEDATSARSGEKLESMSPAELLRIIGDSGIVGMGGAAFPTSVKLSPPPDDQVDILILNGAECEPYLTADHRLMTEKPVQTIKGLELIVKILGAEKAYIGIEDNKPDALEKMEKAVRAAGSSAIVKSCKTKYPQGAEKQLIKAVTGREVPTGKLPFHIGVVVHNVGTAYAVYSALYENKPLIERIVTVSGKAVATPKNLLVGIGVAVKDVIEYCGGFKEQPFRIIMGGPMMGVSINDLNAPVTKATSGIVCMAADEADEYSEKQCIRCGKCIEVCPMGLAPYLLALFAERGKFPEAADAVFCLECGCCCFACPARRPLVQWIRLAKKEVLELQKRQKT